VKITKELIGGEGAGRELGEGERGSGRFIPAALSTTTNITRGRKI